MASAAAWNDKRFEIVIGRLLRVGVILAAAWVLAGGIHYLIQFRGEKPDYKAFHGEPADLRYTNEIVHEGSGIECARVDSIWATALDRHADCASGVFGDRFRAGERLDVCGDYFGRAYLADLHVHQQLTSSCV